MIDIFKWNSANAEGLSVLDLGCGDGRLSRIIAELFPRHTYYLLDGSAVMFEKAKETMKGFNAVFLEKTFERLIAEDSVDQQYDFVFSSMATHLSIFSISNGSMQEFTESSSSAGFFSTTTWSCQSPSVPRNGISRCGGIG